MYYKNDGRYEIKEVVNMMTKSDIKERTMRHVYNNVWKNIRHDGEEEIKKRRFNQKMLDKTEEKASTDIKEKIIWFEKELLWYDVKYNVIGFNTRIHSQDLINNLPRFGTEFKILDIRSGKTYGAYMNIKQYQISSLKSLYDRYPDIEIGDIIRVAISKENKSDILVDFKYQDEIDKKVEAETRNIVDKEKNCIYNNFLKSLIRKDLEYRKLVKERIRNNEYNEILANLRQDGIEEIKRRKLEQKVENLEDEYKRHVKEEIADEIADEVVEEVVEDDIIGSHKNTEFQKKVTVLESQNADLQTKVTVLESQNAELQKKVASLESQIESKVVSLRSDEDGKKTKDDIEKMKQENERILKLMDDDLLKQMQLVRAYKEGRICDKKWRGKMVIIPGIYGEETAKLISSKINIIGIDTFIKDVEI